MDLVRLSGGLLVKCPFLGSSVGEEVVLEILKRALDKHAEGLDI
jgi:hypothetical protein